MKSTARLYGAEVAIRTSARICSADYDQSILQGDNIYLIGALSPIDLRYESRDALLLLLLLALLWTDISQKSDRHV